MIIIMIGVFAAMIVANLCGMYYEKRFEEVLYEKKIIAVISCVCGLAGALFFWYGYAIWKALKFMIAIAFVLCIAQIDKKKMILPNGVIFGMLLVRVLLMAVELGYYREQGITIIVQAVFGLVFGSVVFFVAKIISPDSIGSGDIKLFAVIGLYLGSQRILYAVLASLFCAMVCGIFQVVRKNITMKQAISFGPYIAMGTTVIIMLGV